MKWFGFCWLALLRSLGKTRRCRPDDCALREQYKGQKYEFLDHGVTPPESATANHARSFAACALA